MTDDNVNTRIEGMLSLDEPWQGRFLTLLAQRADEKGHIGHPPTRESVVQWLHDVDIRQEFEVLFDEWQGTTVWTDREA